MGDIGLFESSLVFLLDEANEYPLEVYVGSKEDSAFDIFFKRTCRAKFCASDNCKEDLRSSMTSLKFWISSCWSKTCFSKKTTLRLCLLTSDDEWLWLVSEQLLFSSSS